MGSEEPVGLCCQALNQLILRLADSHGHFFRGRGRLTRHESVVSQDQSPLRLAWTSNQLIAPQAVHRAQLLHMRAPEKQQSEIAVLG